MLEIDDVRAWLIDLGQFESATILAEADFEYLYIDTAFRLDTDCGDTDIYELSIRVPARIYRGLEDKYKVCANQILSAISELSTHTTGSWIREINWLLRIPRIEEVESEPDADELFSDSTLYDVQRLWTKAKSRVVSDPDGAITASKTMLESLCKLIIDDFGGEYTNKSDLPSLYKQVVDYVELSPNTQTIDEYKKLSGSCFTIINSISCIRNRESDSHATKGIAKVIQAKFVVNIAGSIASFLVSLRDEEAKN